MESLRTLKRRARRDLHNAMLVPALYLLGDEPWMTQKLIHVRLHSKFDAVGDLQGTNFNYATRQEVTPKIRFDLTEIDPVNGAIISIEAGEAYRVDNVQPPDDQFVTAEAIRLSEKQATGLPVPEID